MENFNSPLPLSESEVAQSCRTLWDHTDYSLLGSPSMGFSRQEYWSGLPFPSPMQESEKWKWSHWVMSNSQWPHGLQPTRLSIHGIFQARVLEWVAIFFSRESSQPRDQTQICIVDRHFTIWTTREAQMLYRSLDWFKIFNQLYCFKI